MAVEVQGSSLDGQALHAPRTEKIANTSIVFGVMAIDVVLVVCRDCAMDISFLKHHNQQQHSSKHKKGEDHPESMPSKQGIEPWLCGLGKLGSNQKEDRPTHTE